MSSPQCITCNEIITAETDSAEHLFQNSIGGVRKVPGVLHEICNSTAGDTWDADLAKQMNPLCLFLGIVRDRGESPPIKIQTTAGEELKLLPGGGLGLARPTFKVTKTAESANLALTARNWPEARRMLEGAKKKFPKLDVEKALRESEMSTAFPQGAIVLNFQFGGLLAGRAMVKTAVTFAHVAGVDTRACDLGLAYLQNESVSAPFGYFDDRDMVRNRQAGVPFHAVAITGDPATGMLIGYIEYFGAIRIVVGLSSTYNGPAIHKSYGMNPLTGADIGVDVDRLAFTVDELASIYRYEHTSGDAQRRNFSPILDAAMARQFEKEKNRALKDAVEYGFKNCGAKEGDMLTQEQVRKLSGLLTQRLRPFLLRHMVRPQQRFPGPPG